MINKDIEKPGHKQTVFTEKNCLHLTKHLDYFVLQSSKCNMMFPIFISLVQNHVISIIQ